MARPKKDILKNNSIVIRVDSKMKKGIELLAKSKRRSISDYLRILIEDTIELEIKSFTNNNNTK